MWCRWSARFPQLAHEAFGPNVLALYPPLRWQHTVLPANGDPAAMQAREQNFRREK